MNYRRLGKTCLSVSEIGFGGEWLERHSAEECKAALDRAEELGINLLDCWMSEPKVRSNIGAALRGKRERWHIQGHIGSTWQDGSMCARETRRSAAPPLRICLNGWKRTTSTLA